VNRHYSESREKQQCQSRRLGYRYCLETAALDNGPIESSHFPMAEAAA
jgi:hypothetical protein